ncbi:DUF3426 domain-containing protein [Stenotrophomonas sp. C3(2023)]|uniref:DUF3426 domain-containing protein n=1 Tax=Stenotrophomonas sp. C3(2023) TaxID=3080277 RepID=UPI00293D0426|nr:DUF3426 domain-containing protein [Stenotrophomonas sp. C3(2023)]MDV3467496.1 DUF3426 domain-containing protein [Stenotrophomonas sp. C3(2023)]
MTEPTPPRRPLATFLRPRPDAGEAQAVPQPDEQHVQPEGTVADRPAVALLPEAATADDTVPGIRAVAEAPAVESDVEHSAPVAAPLAPPASGAPGFLRAPQARLPPPRWHWAAVAVLGALLLLQIAVADRTRLAADAATRPAISALCGLLGCSLPAWHEPGAFTMTSRDVRPVPGQPGALQVQASIRNDARWTQDWPTLRLSLSDADGRVIGSAVFTPAQYLPSAADHATGLEPGQSAQLAFQVREPAASTVAFSFEFL